MAKTHSQGKPLTLDDICAEALGKMGMTPAELDEYTMEDYRLKRRGYYDALNDHYRTLHLHDRIAIYYGIIYNPDLSLNVRRKKMDVLVPDMYADPSTQQDDHSLYEEKRAHAKRVTEKLRQRAKQPRNRR